MKAKGVFTAVIVAAFSLNMVCSSSRKQASLDTAPDWSSAHAVNRTGRILTVRLDATKDMITIDLSRLGVFDCRVDCFVGVEDRLGTVDDKQQLCIGWLGLRDGHQDGKLWVNRYTCYAGGRVIPP